MDGQSRAGNADVWVMNKDGSGKTRLTTDPAFDGFPDWTAVRLPYRTGLGGGPVVAAYQPATSKITWVVPAWL